MTITLNDVAILAGALVVSLIVAAVVYKIVLIYVKRLTQKTKTTLDDHLITALERPIYFAIIIAGMHIGINLTTISGIGIKSTVFEIAVILLITFTLLKVVDGLVKWYNEEVAAKARAKIGDIIPSVRRLARIIISALGFTMILRSLGIEITPIIAALGIGGLAVALAFQDTLSNFFAGVYITVDRPIKIGDYIKLESGEEGYVVSIGWRSTQIRMLANNLVIVPNSKLSQAIITNYYNPTKDMGVVIQCSVAYDSDLKKVEKVTVETAREIQKQLKGAVPDFDPFIRYHTFGDNGINFSVILRVQEYVDKYLVTHEFIKELHKRYAKEGIEIPFPQRTIHFAKGVKAPQERRRK